MKVEYCGIASIFVKSIDSKLTAILAKINATNYFKNSISKIYRTLNSKKQKLIIFFINYFGKLIKKNTEGQILELIKKSISY